MRIGFIGVPRTELPRPQLGKLEDVLRAYRQNADDQPWLHHGGRFGMEARVQALASRLGFFICLHPPVRFLDYDKDLEKTAQMAIPPESGLYFPHREIVHATHTVVICPMEESIVLVRTLILPEVWKTWNYLGQLKRGGVLVTPSGKVAVKV